MAFLSVLNYAHKLVADHIKAGDTAIDATVGNGLDTLFLLEKVGPNGRVYGFDIQQQALNITAEKIATYFAEKTISADKAEETRIQLFHQSHADMLQCVPAQVHGQVAVIMFNLGYCPGQDHRIVTQPASTAAALNASVNLLKKGGVLTTIVYTGHEGALEEAEAVLFWSSQLPPANYHVFKYHFINQINHPSFLIAIEKR